MVIRRNVKECDVKSWSVVTQTVDSSNNLVYLPSDLTAFCADHTLLIVLPVHAIWASVYGVPPLKRLNDPTWKKNPSPPEGHDCGDPGLIGPLPIQLIRNCSLGSGPWTRFIAGEYNRVTLPGVSQGSISITPWAAATKATWDVQAYESTRWGPGWIGGQLMYEHDRKLPDDFNSFTAAATYDLRLPTKNKFWLDSGSATCATRDKATECGPPLVGIRPLEFIARGGPEWSPSAENTAQTTQGVYMPKDLNFVFGATMRLPIIFSPLGANKTRQASQFTVVPVFGPEGGWRVDSHPVCALRGSSSVVASKRNAGAGTM